MVSNLVFTTELRLVTDRLEGNRRMAVLNEVGNRQHIGCWLIHL